MGMLEEYWKACGVEADAEVLEIDRMEDSISPLDDTTIQIRKLITRFESCYHEADKEAEMIVRAIGSGQIPAEHRHTRLRRQNAQRFQISGER